MQLLAVIIRAINEKNFFDVSHKRANVSLGPPPKGLYFSLLGEIFFHLFSKRAMPLIIRGNVGLNYPLTH